MKMICPLFSLALAVFLCPGCQSRTSAPPVAGSSVQSARNNCYSLLHQLLSDQKNVSLLRFIKKEDDEVKILINEIATSSGAAAKQLEDFAKKDPALGLNDLRLPPGEIATREAIASTKKKELLGQSGQAFELSLLLTQTEALSYASHLAKVASENESQPERAKALATISTTMRNHYNKVCAHLALKATPSATNAIKPQK